MVDLLVKLHNLFVADSDVLVVICDLLARSLLRLLHGFAMSLLMAWYKEGEFVVG